jgi:hypothetical protein
MTHVNPAAATNSTTTAASTAANASAATDITAAAAVVAVAAIIGAVDIAAVVEIAVAAEHAAHHSGDQSTDNRFGNEVAAIPDLLDLRAGPCQFWTGHAGRNGQSGRRSQHHANADKCGYSNTIHVMILFV